MFSKFILVISLLVCVANAAVNYKVRDGNLRKVSKSVKAKVISKIKTHLQSVEVNPEVKRIGKKVADAKKLKAWNAYDSSFDSKFWTNGYFYTGPVSDGCVSPIKQFSQYNSYCYVGTIVGSNGVTYQSAQSLFKSDCSEETIVFYSSSDCSGTPLAQANTESNTYDVCVAYTTDYFTGVQSAKGTCTTSAAAWTGGDAVKIISYEQTETCSGDPDIYEYYLDGCYAISDGGSIMYSSGPTFSVYTSTTDCSGTANQIVTLTSCEGDDGADDDDDDDDDTLIDDAQFTSTDGSSSSSSKYEYTGASSTLVLNYYLSAALVVVFCTLSL